MTLEQLLDEVDRKNVPLCVSCDEYRYRPKVRLLAKMLRAIVEGQHARDLSSDPAVYIEFNPIGIANEILSAAKGSPLTKDELVRRQKDLDDYNQDAAEQRFYDAQGGPAIDGGAE